MRKWLIILFIVAAGLFGLATWLAGKADESKPDVGPVSVEVQNGL